MIRIIYDLVQRDLTDILPWQYIQDERSTYQSIWIRVLNWSTDIQLAPDYHPNFLQSDFNPLVPQTDSIIAAAPCGLSVKDGKSLLSPVARKYDQQILLIAVGSYWPIDCKDVIVHDAEILEMKAVNLAPKRWVILAAAHMRGQGSYIEVPIAENPDGLTHRKRYSFKYGNADPLIDSQARTQHDIRAVICQRAEKQQSKPVADCI